MGRTYLFECPTCAYRARIAGGASGGIRFAVQTIMCTDCKELYDAVTELKVPASVALAAGRWRLKASRLDTETPPSIPPTFQAALNRLLPAKAKRFRWLRFKTFCPVSARHRVRDWHEPGKCPKCGVFMEPNAVPFRLWD